MKAYLGVDDIDTILSAQKLLKTDQPLSADLILCVDVINKLTKEINLKLMDRLSKCQFKYILFDHNPECLDYTQTNLLQYPFNFYLMKTFDGKALMTKEQFLINLQNLDKLVIKCYDGSYMKEYIMFEFHEQYLNYIGNCDDQFTTCGNLQNYFKRCYDKYPDVIMFLWTLSPKIYRRIKHQMPRCKIVVWTDDLHWFDKESKEKNLFSFKNADAVISHYRNFQEFYGLNIDHKLWYYPHICSSHFFRKHINMVAIPKIFMYGAVKNYPLRSWFYDAVKDKDYLVFQKHPGYVKKGYNISLATSEELYKYQFCYTSGFFPQFEISESSNSQYYLIGKFFEIMGCGVLLLCNDSGVKNQLENLGFYRDKHYIHLDENNLEWKINWCMTNENEVLKIRQNAHDLVSAKYRIVNKCRFVNQKISQFVKE